MLLHVKPWIAYKTIQIQRTTNIFKPTASKVWNCTNITNNTNSHIMLGLRHTSGFKTPGELVLRVILVQFHTSEAMGCKIFVSLCVCYAFACKTIKITRKPILWIQSLSKCETVPVLPIIPILTESWGSGLPQAPRLLENWYYWSYWCSFILARM